ncbi:MAG: protoporphyrinogen/coproporphyrinogen oxidase [Actinomycetales bacterium]
MPADVPTWDVAVVGAGMAGLTVAHDVARSGGSVTVLEAGSRVGGLVGPLRLPGGFTLDAGAEAVGTRRPAAVDLARELGLRLEHPAAPSWVQPREGAARPVPPRSLLGIPSDLADPAVTALLGAEEARRAAELDSPGHHMAGPDAAGPDDSLDLAGPDAAEPSGGGGAGASRVPLLDRLPAAASLADVVRLAMGEAVLDLLVRPIAGALHAADPDDLSLDAVAPGLRAALATRGTLRAAVASLVGDGPAVAGVQGGMHRLPEALARAAVGAGAEIRTGARAGSLVRDGETWLVLGADPGTGGPPAVRARTRRVVLARARRVVLAVPGPAALRLLEPHLRTGSVALVRGAPVEHRTLVLDAPALDAAPRGSGLVVAHGATPGGRAVRAKALTHASAKWPWVREHLGGRHAVRLSYGRPGEELRPGGVEEALADAAALLGTGLDHRHLVADAPFSHAGALAPQTPGTRSAVAELAAGAAGLGLHLTGAWVGGTGLPAVVEHARGTARRALTH